MHELSIVQALLEQVEQVREANGGGRVSAVTVRVGAWRRIVPDVFAFYYEILTRDGSLAGSRLDLEQVEAAARCGSCGAEFAVEDNYVVCPFCSSLGATLIRGDELDLVSIDVEE
jgi:hydrogenase nickel incorporation protein HypA/HybF